MIPRKFSDYDRLDERKNGILEILEVKFKAYKIRWLDFKLQNVSNLLILFSNRFVVQSYKHNEHKQTKKIIFAWFVLFHPSLVDNISFPFDNISNKSRRRVSLVNPA